VAETETLKVEKEGMQKEIEKLTQDLKKEQGDGDVLREEKKKRDLAEKQRLEKEKQGKEKQNKGMELLVERLRQELKQEADRGKEDREKMEAKVKELDKERADRAKEQKNLARFGIETQATSGAS